MSASYPVLLRRNPSELALRALGLLAGVGSLLALAAALALLLSRYPPPLALVPAIGIGVLGTLALALARYDLAVAFGFLLLGFVRIEPAPTDVVFALVIAVAIVTGRFTLRRAPPAATGLIAGFLALNLLSGTAVVDPPRAAVFFAITLYLGIFSLWLTTYVDSTKRTRLLLRGYLAAAVLSAALSVLAVSVPVPGGDLLLSEGRAQGLFKDPNVFGPFLVPAALILIEEMLSPRLLRARLSTKAILFLFLTMGIMFSYSRGAWLNFALGVLVMFAVFSMRRGGARRALLLLTVVLVAATSLAAAVAVIGSVDFLQERARLQSYDANRFGAQVAGLEAAERHPFGIGPGQFEQTLETSAHSTYVRALAEQGLLGLVSVLALMVFTLGWAARNAVIGRDSYGLGSAALLAAWCGVLANSLVIDTLHWRHLWLIAALIWAGTMRRNAGVSAWPAGTGARRSPG
jgi:O-antigen ligase